MTREEAKQIISDIDHAWRNFSQEEYVALDMAIKALEQEPCDAISRQAVIRWVKTECNPYGKPTLDFESGKKVIEHLKQMAPVTPQPKTGHWFIDERPESDRETICSNCEQPIFKYHKLDFDYRPRYCPNCGAKMVEPQESEEE